MPLNFNRELDIDTFRDFARENVVYAYELGLRATHEKKRARDLAVKALFGVLKNQQHFDAESRSISEEKAIELVLRSFLISDEKKRLDDDDDKFEVTAPSDTEKADIVARAYSKALSAQPALAPMYSGTRSGLVLIFVAAVICLAIFFIWKDPLGLLGETNIEGNKSAVVNTSVIPATGNFIDVDFKPEITSGQNVPVRINISGPDKSNIVSVTYAGEHSDTFTDAYQCGDDDWIMIADSQSYYKVNIKGNNGLDVTKYFRLKQKVSKAPEVQVSNIQVDDEKTSVTAIVSATTKNAPVSISGTYDVSENDDGTFTVSVPYGALTNLYATDSEGNTASFAINEKAEAVFAPAPIVNAISIGHDSEKIIDVAEIFKSSIENCSISVSGSDVSAYLNDDNTITLISGNGFTGVNQLTLNASDKFGMQCSAVLPVVVINSRPYCSELSGMTAKIKHTPNNQGNLFGSLQAFDKENDELIFTLDSQSACNVSLAQNGSYVLFVDPDFSGRTCSFDFSVSDGILKSGPYKYNVDLENSIPTATSYSQSFVCYGGEDGWYEVTLPTEDADGDVLSWKVASPLVDGRTEQGNYIDYANGYSKLLLKTAPKRNENYEETLELVCTDGWLTSETIKLKCTFRKNKAPRAGAKNSATVDITSSAETFTVDVSDDCPFDKCIISEVIESRGGLVIDRDGWNELKFTISFDDHGDYLDNGDIRAFAILKVKDVVTGETANVKFTITRKAEYSQ